MLEIILKEPIENLIPKLIAFNNKELIADLKPKLEVYKNNIYTDEQIPLAKADRATLNKFRDSIDAERKRIKKVYLEPYEKFEGELKEVTALLDESVQAIDNQVKQYEFSLKEEKRLKIISFWNEKVGDMRDLLAIDKVFNSKWLNTTYRMVEIEKEILTLIDRVNSDLKVIKSFKFKQETHLIDYYLNKLDITATLQEKERIELSEIAQKQALGNDNIKNNVISQEINESDLKQVDFRVWATDEQLQQIKQFLLDNKIKYGKVPTNI